MPLHARSLARLNHAGLRDDAIGGLWYSHTLMRGKPSDRRSKTRIAAQVPVTIKQEGAAISAETRDLSTNGIFLYSDSQFSEGSDLEMILVLPAELTQGETRWACCQASVVRVEAGNGKKFGVAASIRRMEFLPEIPS